MQQPRHAGAEQKAGGDTGGTERQPDRAESAEPEDLEEESELVQRLRRLEWPRPSPEAKKPLTSAGRLSSHHQVSCAKEKLFAEGSLELNEVDERFTDHLVLAFAIAPPNR